MNSRYSAAPITSEPAPAAHPSFASVIGHDAIALDVDGVRRSVVGRFLEHTRLLYFRWGDGAEDELLYLTSADWMSRNMFRRIEIAWPVRDRASRQRVIDEALVPYLCDEVDAWALQPDGSYLRREPRPGEAVEAVVNYFRARVPTLANTVVVQFERGEGPLMVPVPSRSPLCRLQPPLLWWASICATLQ